MVFLALLLIPLLIALGVFVFGGSRITWKEFLLQIAIQAAVAGISVAVMYSVNTQDTEIWNGTVSSKKRTVVSCEHSYQCRCFTSCSGSRSSRSCWTTCSTCYEHNYDVDWDVSTSNGESIEIDREDRQGLWQPKRWTKVVIGEPTSITHGYTNYIKASPDTLFRHQGLLAEFAKILPKYPGDVYDYYRLNRLVLVGGTVPDQNHWNQKLSKLNGDLGHEKQVNIAVVLVWSQPREFYYALQEKWIGAKKNDVVLVVGVDEKLAPQWAEVMAWSKNALFQVTLRDAITGLPLLEADTVTSILRTSVGLLYERKPMKDFQYLAASITPSVTEWVISLIVGFLVAVGVSIWCYKQDIFGDERN